MSQLHKSLLGATMAVVSVMLMIYATAYRNPYAAGWAILIALGANAFVNWLMKEQSRDNIVAALNGEHDKIDRLVGAILGELGDDRPTRLRR